MNTFRRLKPVFLAFLLLLIIFFTKSCISTEPVLQPIQPGEIPQNFVPAKHMVFIGLDGWGGAYIPKAKMPTVKRMMSNGAWTIDAQSVMPSVSWPNWSSIFCGAPQEQNNTNVYNSIFTVINNKQKNRPGFFYEWTELQKICPDSAAEKHEIFSNLESAQKVAAFIKEQKPFFTAVSFDQPDATGHSIGWGTAEYYTKLTEMDNLIAIIEQAVKDAGIYDSTVFVLSADHGGSGRGHGANIPAHRRIPMIFYGSGIKKGYKIFSPIDIYDITPTMAAILGLDVPREWIGRVLHEILK